MVYLKDEESEFDAPIDFVWKYVLGGEGHDSAHTTTRNSKFKKVSDITFEYASERRLGGQWAPDRMRITMLSPVAVATEWLEGALAGSTFVYVYSPRGNKTAIAVYGEFTSKSLSPTEVEAMAREFLDSEFRDDAPRIRAEYQRAQGASA